ncbi:MAG: hypothetical protein WBP41_07040, partial [Saprospiraceae bacterium]
LSFQRLFYLFPKLSLKDKLTYSRLYQSMKPICLSLFIFFSIVAHIKAQPFDTLLVQYQSIGQIYPLADGSFILIGYGQESIVERIDSTGKSIWSLSFGLNYNEDDILDDFAVHMLPNDSTIQIAVARKYCDTYDTSDVKVYTLTFKGLVLDSLLVRAKNLPQHITLLSGNPLYPRLAYVKDNYVVLQYSDADTVQLQLAIPGADSTVNQFIGPPAYIAMSSKGTLLIATRSGSLMRFRDDGMGYHFLNVKFFSFFPVNIGQLLFVDEDFYILVYLDKMKLYSFSNGLEKSFSITHGFLNSVILRPPYLYAISDDSLYMFDTYLNKIYNEPIPEYEQRISGFAIRNRTLFTVGSGFFYREGGFLGSENLDTHIGPKFYDIELVDFEVGPYDSVFFQNGFSYVYSIPNASVTIKNNCDFSINRIQVVYTYSTSYCSVGNWTKEIQNAELLPGETKTYVLQDIFIVKEYPFSLWFGACVYAIRPDDHADDHFSDNEVCKKVELLPSSVDLTELPIRHSPSAIADIIRFFAPQEYNFDLTIYNFTGIEVFNSHANTSSGYSVDLNFLPPGIYIFQYYLPVEQKGYVEKILKY